ncbi:celp0028 effector like protein [Stemphylium lycopersici]|uniref:Celp0028 effector like protein n=1 Tax=Stemphylium lycopersici TaxID=183478 RepID=A0A364MZL1_STELY|nr:celp0028 effector like protein [Stemphylium lycopersici]RAR00315.1 celp0028 effector like protein [Stemphylium lycopersici]RAR08028.1 celp0028 effector like protein [Stemphylium lycopersici]
MHFTSALALAASAAMVAAAPAPSNAAIKITQDDVVLHGNGRMKVMKRSEFEALNAGIKAEVPPMPSYLDANLITYSGNQTLQANGRVQKRATELVVPGEVTRFLGWDVQMSSIVRGGPGSGTRISVAQGYSISNSIAVGTSSSLSVAADFLTASMSIDYTETWTTGNSQDQTLMADVPTGKYGCFVSNPWTNRAQGDVWTGSIGGGGSLSHYQADSFESKQYGDLAWVNGIIQLCIKDTIPLTRCLGEGEF